MLTLLAIVYGVASLLLVIIVLLQAGKGAGMGLFGGGASNTTFGAQGGDIMTRITTWLGIIFFGVALVIALIAKKDTTVSKGLGGKKGTTKVERGVGGPFITGSSQDKKSKKKSVANPKKKTATPKKSN